MAIKDVESKCWILALFVRDDGERFLLGDGSYEFTEKQLHFTANTMANDVVEVQGNDGYLLAGQVRRPSTQTFDGYVGDSSTSKALVEERRRAFFAFFRKNFFYKVIYIFPDGSAIQRKRGFLVDAPEVKEIRQIYPQYHVALNFEDINYYYYDEDSDGEEIFGKSATINLNSVAQSGGLIWLLPSEMTLTGEGVNFTLSGTVNGTALTSAELKGNTFQQTYSGKNLTPYPYSSSTLTTNGITITNNNNGSVTINGSITSSSGSNATFDLTNSSLTLPAGTYYVVPIPDVNSSAAHYTLYDGSQYILASSGTNWSFTLSEQKTFTRFYLEIYRSYTGSFDNATFFPMLSTLPGQTSADFEPYVGGIPAPNPGYPQEVQTATGRQVVTISNGTERQEYEVNLGDIELCKIGNYQDGIYKSGGDWYLHKAVGKYVFTGSEVVGKSGTTSNNAFYYASSQNVGTFGFSDIDQTLIGNNSDSSVIPPVYSSNFTSTSPIAVMTTSIAGITFNKAGSGIDCRLGFTLSSSVNTAQLLTTWLATNTPSVYYPLATPTDTQITNTALIAQLNALAAATTYNGTTSFTVDGNGNLAAILAVEVETVGGGGVEWDENGAVWEEGKPSYSIISVDSIDNVYPVLTITGRTVNPVLTDVTTGTMFQYNGTITDSQVLRVDMMNKTATLNGVSVIGNVTGDWLYLAPGNNRITYTADNADAPNATVEWQEIVG